MKYLMVLIFVSLSKILFSQDSVLIKLDTIKSTIEKTYLRNDSSRLVFGYTKNGKPIFIKSYTNIKCITEHGKWVTLYPNGSVKNIQYYKNGEPIGIWYYYAKNGNKIEEYNYDFDLNYEENREHNIKNYYPHIEEEQQAKFNGGDLELFRQYLQHHLHIDWLTFEKFIGSVKHIIKADFTIEADGSINKIYIFNTDCPILEKEVARVIRESPIWSPATLGGKPVPQRFVMPAIFIFD